MNLLAFDTSTDTLSIAVQHGDAVWQHTGPGGAQASATLIPTVRSLMAQAGLSFDTLEAIVFGRGPGSFTGLRTACAVAQGLAFGARGGQGVPVLDARMDEVYHARCEWVAAQGRWHTEADFGLGAPESVLAPAGWTVAGNARTPYGERLAPMAAHVAALPTATALLRLAPALLAGGEGVPAGVALPRYIRDKVAQPPAEGAALRAARAVPAPL